jgi:hypothetical protein
VIVLIRYQAAVGLRSHRWIFPLIAYVILVSVGDAEGGTPLSASLGWSAAMLVPVVAFGTRSMLTAEPDAARACVAAPAGPVRAQIAALATALAGGVVLAIAGACAAVLISKPVLAGASHSGLAGKIAAAAEHPGPVLAGLATAAVCLLVGSAVGALFNPPLLRHPGIAVLTTLGAAILAVATDVSPAGAALRHATTAPGGTAAGTAQWPGLVPVIVAAILLALAWTASALAAARRA